MPVTKSGSKPANFGIFIHTQCGCGMLLQIKVRYCLYIVESTDIRMSGEGAWKGHLL